MKAEPEALLQIRGAAVAFGGVKAVDDVSMDLRSGIVTGLVGPNGAGKTTLFNLITGHLPMAAGSIRARGREIGGMKPYRVARLGIARSFQDLRLFGDMSVEENVLTVMEPGASPIALSGPSHAERRRRARDVLERAHLADKRSVRAKDLAYAERKFLSLARIMAMDAWLWLLDEPASGLDPASYDLFLGLVREEVARGVTVCIIEHNLDIVVGICDRIAFLDRGRLLADDEPDAVLNDEKLAAIYFGERA
ncbi:ABC transporter ATP-binding protein [Acuticoccus sp.]|uniref:ABC transporter ATP-binding protein n=1 Tax=Acuticoccus sp. TaxID=1904378 RepID=UPI003B52115B